MLQQLEYARAITSAGCTGHVGSGIDGEPHRKSGTEKGKDEGGGEVVGNSTQAD